LQVPGAKHKAPKGKEQPNQLQNLIPNTLQQLTVM
jgi:hypothetical protein